MCDEEVMLYYRNIHSQHPQNGWRMIRKDTELFQYMKSRFLDSNDDATPSEIFYRIENKIETLPICPVCGKNVKFNHNSYARFCSRKCALSDCGMKMSSEVSKKTCLDKYGVEYSFQSKNNKDKSKTTMLEKYGVENAMQSKDVVSKVKNTKLERYGDENYNNIDAMRKTKQVRYGDENYNNSKKNKLTCIERYGVENVFMNETIKNKSRETCIKKYGVEYATKTESQKRKSRETCIEKYGVDYPMQSESIRRKSRETCIEKYGVDSYQKTDSYRSGMSVLMKTEEMQKRMNDTKRENGTFNSSKLESLFEMYLETYYTNDYSVQYHSKEYPFNCDFYIHSMDLYVELQGSWTHGGHPYDDKDLDDVERANELHLRSLESEYYAIAFDVWTKRDVKKRNIAKENGIDLLEIFTNDVSDAIAIFEEYINNK